MNGEVRKIEYKDAVDFLLPKHYSGRIPSISFAFGWYIENNLVAVCTFGKPASPQLCYGICGKELQDKVYELNRLCKIDELNLQISEFVATCLRRLSGLDLIIVSYSDVEMNHHGYVYQATNFIYTGATKQRTDKYTDGNKHSRHYSNENQNGIRKVRSSKHRYVYFATIDKKIKREYLQKLKYNILPYPKGENKNYILGDYLKPKLIKKV